MRSRDRARLVAGALLLLSCTDYGYLAGSGGRGGSSASGGTGGSSASGGTGGSSASGGTGGSSASGGTGGSSASGGTGSSAGSAGDAGADAPPPCGDGSAVDFEIPQISEGDVTLDGSCAEWSSIPLVHWANKNTWTETKEPECRLAYSLGTTPRLYVCCTVWDGQIIANVTSFDLADQTRGVWTDDSVEVTIKGDATDTVDSTWFQLHVNAAGYTADNGFDGTTPYDFAPDFLPSNQRVPHTQGAGFYTLEFAAKFSDSNVGFVPKPGAVGRLGMIVNDTDSSGQTHILMFGSSADITTDPATWGTYRLGCR